MKIYNKLVRDKIPDIIEQDGSKAYIRYLDEKEYNEQLNKKLLEEVKEYIESEEVEEIADILEVIESILKFKKVSEEEILKIKNEKKSKRGGFDKKIFLEKEEKINESN